VPLQPRKFFQRRLIKATLFAAIGIFVSLVSTSSANAGYADFKPLSIGGLQGSFTYFDISSSGSVIVAAQSCPSCWDNPEPGYAYVSTDGGANYVAKTDLGKQAWRGAEVSRDGTTIALISNLNLYISTNSGSTFSIVYYSPSDRVRTGKTFVSSALSGDGKMIFITTSDDQVFRIFNNTSTRRWERVSAWTIPLDLDSYAITTNYSGSKTYIAATDAAVFKIYRISSLVFSESTITPVLAGGSARFKSIRTTDSGNDVYVSLARYSEGNIGVGYYQSSNSGANFTQVKSINGQDLGIVSAVEPSEDGENLFVVSTNFRNLTRLYTRHGANGTWYLRVDADGYVNYDQIRLDSTTSKMIFDIGDGYLFQALGGPPVPNEPAINQLSETSVQLTWSFYRAPPLDPIQAVTDVEVQYRQIYSGTWIPFVDGVIGGNTGTITVTGLQPSNQYIFRVRAKNAIAYSDWSSENSELLFDKPGVPIASQITEGNSFENLILLFVAPISAGTDYPDPSFDWEYSLDSGATWLSKSGLSYAYIPITPTGSPVLIIHNLESAVPIYIRLKYSNGRLTSDWSTPQSFKINLQPSAPANFQVNTVFTTANLSWETPTYLAGNTLQSYSLAYKRADQNQWTAALVNSLSRSASISGLQAGQLYDYKVFAVTTSGRTSLEAFLYNDRPLAEPKSLAIHRGAAGGRSSQAFTVQPQIKIRDVSNNVVTTDSRTVVVAQVNNGGEIVGIETATASAGYASFSNLGIKGVTGRQYVVTYRSGSLTIASETVTITAGPVATMRFVNQSVGGKVSTVFPTQPTVEILDVDNNRVTADDTTTVTISISEGYIYDANFNQPSVRAVDGLVTFSGVKLTGVTGARPVLTYSATGLTSLRETLTVTTGDAYTFTRTVRAADAYIGSNFGTQPVYAVLDAASNPITDSDYTVSISSSQGTLTGETTIRTVNGIATYTNLGLTGVNANQLVILTVSSPGFNSYTGDSIITRQGTPNIWMYGLEVSRGTAPFTVSTGVSNTAGTWSYSSSNSSVISFSGTTATVGSAGTATITATFTPTDTTNYKSGETTTAIFKVTEAAGSLLISITGNSAEKGVVKAITATATDVGAVTFFVNGKRIAGCISKRISGGSASCNWKPAVTGTYILSAYLNPDSVAIDPIKSSNLNVSVGRRTGRR
jgi:hypothetical protein